MKKKKQPPVVNRMCEDDETEDMIVASVDTNSKVNFLQDAWISDNRLVFVGDQTLIFLEKVVFGIHF